LRLFGWSARLFCSLKLTCWKKRFGTKEKFELEIQGKTAGKSNMNATILSVLGIILVIVGASIITIRGAPLRGSGVGTISLLAGVLLLVIAFLRFYNKSKQWAFSL
jgi:uncharacterized Tic20 family protein